MGGPRPAGPATGADAGDATGRAPVAPLHLGYDRPPEGDGAWPRGTADQSRAGLGPWDGRPAGRARDVGDRHGLGDGAAARLRQPDAWRYRGPLRRRSRLSGVA